MKNLLDKFSAENARAQELLGTVQASLSEGIAPSEEICEMTSTTLSCLRSTYLEIKSLAAATIAGADMPTGDAPVAVYANAVENSAKRQKQQTIDVLELFLSSYSDEERYDSALEEARREARLLLAELRSDTVSTVDVSSWDAFNRGVPCEDFDSESGTSILDAVSESFPVLAVRGLMLKKYRFGDHVSHEAAPVNDKEEPEVKNSVVIATPVVISENSAIDTEPTDEVVQPSTCVQQNAATTNDESATDSGCVHPRNPLKQIKLPSDQKLREVIICNEQLFRHMIEKMVATPVMSEDAIIQATASDRFSAEMCLNSLRVLETKGYLAAYEYEGRVLYCITAMVTACLKKDSLNRLIKRLLKIKKTGLPALEASVDMPSTMFEIVAPDDAQESETTIHCETESPMQQEDVEEVTVQPEVMAENLESPIADQDSDTASNNTSVELDAKECPDAPTVDEANASENSDIDFSAVSDCVCNSLLMRKRTPTDEEFVRVVRKLIEEQSVNGIFEKNYSKLAQALILAKGASSAEGNVYTKNTYTKLLLAMRIGLDKYDYTGGALADTFADLSEEDQSLVLSAYCLAMLVPAHPYDYTLRNTVLRLGAEFDSVFPAYSSMKPLFRRLLELYDVLPEGFNASVLDMLSDHAEGMAYLEKIKSAASGLLREPNIKTKMHGLPELCSACFGVKSDLYAALEIVVSGNIAECDLVKTVLSSFCDVEDGRNIISDDLIETTIDREWKTATKGKSTSRAQLGFLARKQVLEAFRSRIEVLISWVEYDTSVDEKRLPGIRKLKNQILSEVALAKETLHAVPADKAPAIVAWMLSSVDAKLKPATDNEWLFADLLFTGIISMDDNGNPLLDATWNHIPYYEPWRLACEHIVTPRLSLNEVVDAILDSQSSLCDNLHQLEMIGRYFDDDTETFVVSEQQRFEAQRTANDRLEEFKNRLELAYTYNRIEENDKENLLAALYGYRDAFYATGDYANWRRFIAALGSQIDAISAKRKRKLRADLDACFSSLEVGSSSSLLDEANHLLEEDENFAVTEDYINRFRSGERELTDELSSVLHDPDSFSEFISDAVFEPLYNECSGRPGQALSKFGYDYTRRHYPADWTDRHREDSRKLISSWPIRRGSATPGQIETLFRGLGFSVVRVERETQYKDEVYKLYIQATERNKPDYGHPISAFGTQAISPVNVVILFGQRMAQELVDTITNMNLGGISIVLNDRALDRAYRRQVAEIFHTRTSGQNRFLLVDQVLALHLALKQNTDRLPVMLKCTLPYTSYQPFLRDGGFTPDEMFCGRTSELSTITDPNGACVVYGGRQLGKTALLQRAESLSIKLDRKAYAAYCSILKLATEAEVVEKILHDIKDKPHMKALKLEACTTLQQLCDQFSRLLDSGVINNMLLLIDEADSFLYSISDQKYEAIRPLVELKRMSQNRFKFVLAGLHNVCRAKNATSDNGLFGQLGQPLCVKPLSPTDALQLISRPLRYLGFQVDRFPHLETILTNTNYYPGILQFFGYTLVQTLTSQYGKYYRSTNGNPPFTLQKDQLGAIMSSTDLNNSIKDKFRWSLELDARYFMLARCVAMLYYENQDDPNAEQRGFSVSDIMNLAKEFDICCLGSESKASYTNLLDEMVAMGILSCPDTVEKRYRLRRRSFLNIIGADVNLLLDEIIESNKEDNT